MNLFNGTYFVADHQRGSGAGAGALLSQACARLLDLKNAWSKRRARAREIQDLHRFSDRELWDIGVNRSDIMLIEKGIYRRGW